MIVVILFLGFLLRLILINQSLWLDEAISVLASKNLSFWQFVTGYPIGDFHPPGFFAILWVWTRIFGFSEISVRIPSVILGVLTIYFTYLLGKDLFSKKIGLIAAFLLSLSPLHIYYSQEARMYSLAAFSVAISFYFLNKFLVDKKYFLYYAFSIGLILYSDYVAYFIIPAQIIFVLFKKPKAKKFFSALILGLLTILPWLQIFPQQFISGRQTALNVPGWATIVGSSNIKSLILVFVKAIVGRISYSDKTVYMLIIAPILLLYSYLALKPLKKMSNNTGIILNWIFVPILLAFVISFFVPVLSYFRMIFILPAFYLLVAQGLNIISGKYFKPILITLILISLLSLCFFYLNPKFQRENWKELESFLESRYKRSIVLFEDSNLPAPFVYYKNPKILAEGAIKNFPAKEENDILDFESIQNIEKVYLVDYLVEIADPKRLVDKQLTKLGWRVISVYDIPSLGFIYEYSK